VNRLGAALLIAAVSLGGCGDGGPDDYDDEVEREFVDTCTAASEEKVCRCLYDRLEEEVPFERFEEVDRQLAEDPTDLPADISRLAVVCATEAGSAG
jgi:hypothetical protein